MKKKILLISDDIRVNSGVGMMSRYITEGTKDVFDWFQMGSLTRHPLRGQVQKVGETTVLGVENFGPFDLIREVIRREKPDAMFLFTDPRFFEHIFRHEEEVRSRLPIYYLNIWDGGPPPLWNFPKYMSVDRLGCISRQTYALVGHVSPDVPRSYVPHGTDLDVFRPLPDEEVNAWFRKKTGIDRPPFVITYVNRNIRRKQPGDIVLAVQRLIEKTGDRQIALVMRTDAVDADGTDIRAVAEGVGFRGKLIFFGGMEPEELNRLYNAGDVTVNIASNEGFGIGTIESLASGTPIIVNMTGGLQDQVGLMKDDGSPVTLSDYTSAWYTNADGRFIRHGAWSQIIVPKVRTVNGSPVTPFVLQEYADPEDLTAELLKAYAETREQRKTRGLLGRSYLVQAGMTREVMSANIERDLTRMIEDFVPRPRYRLIEITKTPLVTHGRVTERFIREVA